MISILAAALLVIPATLEAYGGGLGGRWWNDPKVCEQVGLSPEQVEQMKTLYAGHRKQMADLRADLEKRQVELEQILDQPSVDKAALGKKIDDVVAARAKLDRERMMALAEVRGVLSADQYTKLRSLQRDLRGGGGVGGGKARGGRMRQHGGAVMPQGQGL